MNLDFIFTEAMYNFMGKVFTLYILYKLLNKIHTKLYTSIHLYSYTFDVIALPFHYINIMYFLMPQKVISWYKVVSNIESPNENFKAVKKWLYDRLYGLGYSGTEIDNFRIEYRNSLK